MHRNTHGPTQSESSNETYNKICLTILLKTKILFLVVKTTKQDKNARAFIVVCFIGPE